MAVAAPRRALIVVTGHPRSGTSMAMQMLAAGGIEVLDDGSRPADAGNPRGYFEDARVKRLAQDASWLAAERGRAVKIVLPLLSRIPPGFPCDVVWMVRPRTEVLASQRELLRLSGAHDDGLRHESRLDHAMARVEAEAGAWVAQREGARVLRLEYARVLGEPETAVRSLVSFLRKPLDAFAMAGAVDASLRRVVGRAGGPMPA